MNKNLKKVAEVVTGRKFLSASTLALILAAVVMLNIFLYSLTSLFGWYLYTPDTRVDLSLTGSTDTLFEEANPHGREVTITFCQSRDDISVHDTGAYVWKTALGFEERYGFINVEYKNLHTDRGELSKYTTDMKGNETPLYTTSVIFSSGNNYRVLTDYTTSAGYKDFYTLDSEGYIYAYSGEEVMASMICWVLSDEHKNAYVTTGHSETVDVTFANLLSSAGYYVSVINLRERAVPEDANLVIISNPTADFAKGKEGSGVHTEIERLESYMNRGGNLYVSLDPYARKLPVLEEFIARYGISLSGELSEGGVYQRDIVMEDSQAISNDGLTFVAGYGSGALASAVKSDAGLYGTGRVVMRKASRLELSKGAEALLVSSSSSVCYSGDKVSYEGGGFAVAGVNRVENADGSSSTVVVIPTVLMSGADALITNGYSNRDFFYSVFSNLFGADFAPYGTRHIMYDTSVLEDLTSSAKKAYVAVLVAIPVVIAAAGFIIIRRRKNR